MTGCNVVSLFSGAGIADLGLRSAGFNVVAMNELAERRAELAEINFPESRMVRGDIWQTKDELLRIVNEFCGRSSESITLVLCTAPCQGMSKNSQGKLLSEIRKGERPKMDPRNRLILPALEFVRGLRPEWVVFENVPQMRHTAILDDHDRLKPMLEVISEVLAPMNYEVVAHDVEFADYGIPQRRQRLITVATRNELVKDRLRQGFRLIPTPTHARGGQGGRRPWVSVRRALKGFPPLDASSRALASVRSPAFHRVPVLDPVKYEWIRNTPPGGTAFDNQCVNPTCRYQYNPSHGSKRNHDGVNQSRKDTPLYCRRCGALLPRPHTRTESGELRIMSGYTSAYKRMDADLPSPTLTRNLSFPCSDHKIHPSENRVLSLAEAFVIHSLDRYAYRWGPVSGKNGKPRVVAPDTLIRLVIGESIPPFFMEVLGRHILALRDEHDGQGSLLRETALSAFETNQS